MLYLICGAAMAALFPYVPVVLQQHGLDPAAIGLVTAVGALASTVAVPIWGHAGDAIVGRRRAFQLAACLAVALSLVLAGPIPAAVFAALIALLTTFQGTFMSLSDALAVNAMSDAHRQYGRIRYLSSLSFAVVVTFTGFVYDRTGYGPTSYLFAALSLALLIVVQWIPDLPIVRRLHRPVADRDVSGPASVAAGEPEAVASRRFGSFGEALARRPQLWAAMLAIVLIHFGVVAGWTFLTLRIVELGGQPSDVALSAGVGAFAEIPGMLLAGRVAARIGLRGLFASSAALYGLCFASWIVLGTPAALIATRAVCGISLAGLWVGSVLTMAALLPDRLQATGQGLYQMTAFGIAAVIANLLGGWIYVAAGHALLFGLATLAAAASIAVAWVALPRRGRDSGAVALDHMVLEAPLT